MARYPIVLEQTPTGWSTWSPDVPGCVSTGRTREEAEANMRDAVQAHLDLLREEGAEVAAERLGMGGGRGLTPHTAFQDFVRISS